MLKKSASRPSPENVSEYCREKGYTHVDAERFVDFYASKGWMVGKNRMKDWKAAVRNWEHQDRSQRQELTTKGSEKGLRQELTTKTQKKPTSRFANFEQRQYEILGAKTILRWVKPRIDKNNTRYENGLKGGRKTKPEPNRNRVKTEQ